MSAGDDERRQHDARARVGSELLPGRRLERLLALGELGAVYAASRPQGGRVAIKLFHAELAAGLGSDVMSLLTRAEEIGHPRVVTPLELLAAGESSALVLPLIRGESLGELVARRRGRIPPSEALRIAADVLEVVGTAHAHGLPHGALSLSHALLDESGSTHLIGFGEAALRARLGLVPDPAFHPPEHDPRAPSAAADLWAVAAILFALLTGSAPRPGATALPEHAPGPLAHLLARAFDPRPDRRFPDAGTFLAAMTQVSDLHEIQHAHPLGRALATQSPGPAPLDPARVATAPRPIPVGSSSPRRPPSEPPPTPRSPLAPSPPPASASPAPPREEAPAEGPLARRGTTPPSGTAPSSPAAPTPTTTPTPATDDDGDELTGASEELRAEAARMIALSTFDAALPLEDAWQAARAVRAPSGFEQTLADLAGKLGSPEAALRELAVELRGLTSPDPARLIRVVASCLEGPSLGPALDAFAPALAEHVTGALEHEPEVALRLLRLLQDAVRAPRSLMAREQTRVIDAVASPGTIHSLFARLGGRVSEAATLDALAALLPAVGPKFAAELAWALPQIADLTLRAKVIHHLESELTDHEAALGELVRTAEPRLALEVARILSRIDTLAARDALRGAAGSRHAVVRIEALGLAEGASSERLRVELRQRLQDGPATERIQTLRALSDLDVRVAAPFIALRLRSAQVDALPLEERRALFHALVVLAPARAETVAMEILQHKKLLSTSAHEETRALAASALGEVASSEEAEQVLTDHAHRRFGTSERVRQAAAQALAGLHARRAEPRRPR